MLCWQLAKMIHGSMLKTLSILSHMTREYITKLINLFLGSSQYGTHLDFTYYLFRPCLDATITTKPFDEPFIKTLLFYHETAHSTMIDLPQLMLHEVGTHTTLLLLESTSVSWDTIPYLLEEVKLACSLSLSCGFLLPNLLEKVTRCLRMISLLYSTPWNSDPLCFATVSLSL